MRIDGKPGFISGDIERGHVRTPEAFHQLGRQQALFPAEMAQSAEDQPGLDSRSVDTLLGGAIDRSDHGFGRQPLAEVQERRKTNLDVDDVVGAQLLEQVLGREAKGVFRLHQLESPRRAGQKIGQA